MYSVCTICGSHTVKRNGHYPFAAYQKSAQTQKLKVEFSILVGQLLFMVIQN
jgi:hypothetical protein